MKRLRETGRPLLAAFQRLGRYLSAIGRTVHPVRAIFEVCGTVVFAVPFLAAFAMNRSAPLYLYLLYPLLFLVSHFVWFRLPSVDRRVRWFLFWLTLALVAALGSGFLYRTWQEAGAGFPPQGFFAIPQWVNPSIDVPFPTVAAYFLAPSAFGSALYCFVLSLFLRVYRKHRAEEHRRRSHGDGRWE